MIPLTFEEFKKNTFKNICNKMLTMEITPKYFVDDVFNILFKAQCEKCAKEINSIIYNYNCICLEKKYSGNEWIRFETILSYLIRQIDFEYKLKHTEFYYRLIDILDYENNEDWDIEDELVDDKKEYRYIIKALDVFYALKNFF